MSGTPQVRLYPILYVPCTPQGRPVQLAVSDEPGSDYLLTFSSLEKLQATMAQPQMTDHLQASYGSAEHRVQQAKNPEAFIRSTWSKGLKVMIDLVVLDDEHMCWSEPRDSFGIIFFDVEKAA